MSRRDEHFPAGRGQPGRPHPGTRAPVNAPPQNPKATSRLLRKLAIWLLILVGLPYFLYKLNFPTYSWGQKTTVTVMTPAGERSGSAVVQVRWADTPDILPDAPSFQSDVRGEATVVDLGEDRYLFALISGAARRGVAVYGDGVSYWLDQVKATAASRGETREIPPAHRPVIVTFADINDPASVQRVDPDDLDASLGCDTPQADDAFPWRRQGKTWRQWQEAEALEHARQAAARAAGLPAGLSAAMIAADRMIGTHVTKTEPELARLRALQSQFTYEQFDAWRKAKWKLQQQFTLASRDTSRDCHRLTSLTLAITGESVTRGRVEAVLGWLGDRQLFERIWPSLSRDIRSLLSSVNWKKG